MVTWGSLGGSWQYAAGVPSNASVHPKLFEAFGAGPPAPLSAGSGSRYGGTDVPTFNDAAASSLAEDEVPRTFSMKAQLGSVGGGGGLLRSGASGGSAVQPSALLVGDGLAGALPYGDPSWVTVFGFPGRAASLVRQQLETLCGPIVEVRYGDGNFMHVRFHSVAAANQCLAHHGHAVLGKLLIGCIPCTSSLVGASGGASAAREAEDNLGQPGSSSAWTGAGEWDTGAGRFANPSVQGAALAPQVTRGGLLWRILDMLLDF
eukprot:gnl/TRDRNA2_/TRDRNA2_188964_c0_seq1.p1 gnl/TRDRNA2_/TRDRNA2_188964_c0~~gnl/TRDRNA2_/TRDRNA2_188964_c0_seq1.p1  ORF type:complete len:262 (-),score=41.33 gnl/TRDRNA2_/TRDRNA2_188964_c0_seq1:147-932(-)